MHVEITQVDFLRPVGGTSLLRPTDRISLSFVNLNGLRGICIQDRAKPGYVFTPETNVLKIHYAERQEPVPAVIQETKQHGSQRSGPRTP